MYDHDNYDNQSSSASDRAIKPASPPFISVPQAHALPPQSITDTSLIIGIDCGTMFYGEHLNTLASLISADRTIGPMVTEDPVG